jgi:hypothetical protein
MVVQNHRLHCGLLLLLSKLEPTFGGFITSGGRRKQNRFAALWDSRKEAGNSNKTFLGSSPKTKHSLIFGAHLRKVF